MPTTLRQFIRMRSTPGGAVFFVTFASASPFAPEVWSSAPEGELVSLSETPSFITVGAWQVRLNSPTELAAASLEAVNASTTDVAGYGLPGLTLRGVTDNRITMVVSDAGVISASNKAGQTSYTDGSSKVNLCAQHNLTYRPDERIYRQSRTHCPVDGAPLRSPLRYLRHDIDREAESFEEELW